MGVIFKNNVMYGAGDIEISPVCYSEEEREVGCWTDGKPLYQKTWSLDTSLLFNANTWTAVNEISTSIIATIVSCRIVGAEPAFFEKKNNVLRIYNNGSAAIYIKIITLTYTKTTDTPGSGIWIPSGVPAVHYSTDEQVVGTWVDGSTLYEQTIYVENPTKSSTSGYYYYNVFSTATDIDFATLLNATIYDATDGRWLDLPHERMISSEAIQIQGMVREDHSYQFQVFFQTNQSYNITKMIATIRYTKTTS